MKTALTCHTGSPYTIFLGFWASFGNIVFFFCGSGFFAGAVIHIWPIHGVAGSFALKSAVLVYASLVEHPLLLDYDISWFQHNG